MITQKQQFFVEQVILPESKISVNAPLFQTIVTTKLSLHKNKTVQPFRLNCKYFCIKENYTARVTLPERRQRVQALIRRGEPLTIALTRFTLGFHVLFERLCE